MPTDAQMTMLMVGTAIFVIGCIASAVMKWLSGEDHLNNPWIGIMGYIVFFVSAAIFGYILFFGLFH